MTDGLVTVLIPAYNEADRIYETIKTAAGIPGVDQVLVVDDGSADETAELGRQAGAQVLVLKRNGGKGAALNAAANFVRGDLVLILDADLGKSAGAAAILLEAVREGKADMTVAAFPRSGKMAGFGLVKGLARVGIKYYTGLCMNAPLSGQRAMTREVFMEILPFAGGFGVEVAATVKAGLMGYRVLEVPVGLSHRETGRDWRGFIHRGKQFRDVARALVSLKAKRCRRVS